MNHDAVALLIRQKASRFGDRDPQTRRLLVSKFEKVDPEEVRIGLVQVFTTGEPPPTSSAAQELAGHLLVELNPVGEVDLDAVLRAALPRYELSVEQFPYFLAAACGKQAVLDALARIVTADLPQEQRRAAETMSFWLRQWSQTSFGANEA
jgi:hypothetical protein